MACHEFSGTKATHLWGHDRRVNARQHVEGKGSGFSGTRLALTDEVTGTARQLGIAYSDGPTDYSVIREELALGFWKVS